MAKELTEHNALEAHVRDELGINEMTQAKPLQAALASGASFTMGGALPLLVSIFLPLDAMEYYQYAFALLALVFLGAFAARTGGSSVGKAVLRITFWGTIAMGLSALVGYWFGIQVS